MAIKDEIWDRVMQRLAQGDSFKIKELQIDDSMSKTARRTLREMEDMGWVERDPPRSSIWRPGPFSRLYFRDTDSATDDDRLVAMDADSSRSSGDAD